MRSQRLLNRTAALTFNIGPWQYAVEMAPANDMKHWESGEPLMGKIERHSRRILIADDIGNREERFATLLHELAHAWMFHLPRPRTDEEICELFATISVSALRDLLAQGGLEALDRLTGPGRDGAHLKLAGESEVQHA